jgi:hypothetical protein
MLFYYKETRNTWMGNRTGFCRRPGGNIAPFGGKFSGRVCGVEEKPIFSTISVPFNFKIHIDLTNIRRPWPTTGSFIAAGSFNVWGKHSTFLEKIQSAIRYVQHHGKNVQHLSLIRRRIVQHPNRNVDYLKKIVQHRRSLSDIRDDLSDI